MLRRTLALVALLATIALPARAGAALVTIHYDSYGVPHITGQTPEAMAYGAGFVLARDRLFETDVIRRLGQGRLSEVLGAGPNDGNLVADKATRREFYDAADIRRQVSALPADIRAMLQAFSDGFNASLAAQMANPVEVSALFGVLGYVPEPWTPEDSATVIMLFTIVTFAGEGEGGELRNAALLADLVDEHGVDAALAVWQDLLLRNDNGAPAVVPAGEGPTEPFVSAAEPAPEQIDLALQPGIGAAADVEAAEQLALRRALRALPVPKVGSYMVAATGARTASGKGLLLGAPQAGFFLPSLFYEMGLHAPGIDCTGFTVPGLGPYIGIGWCNEHAWSLVAGNAGDQVDLYVEELCGDGSSYLYGEECVPMTERVERYVARTTVPSTDPPGPPPPPRIETETILSTVHGPVFHAAGGRAFVWRRAQAGQFVNTFHGTRALNSARSFAELEAGAREITATYNFLYADTGGTIAYRFTGYQPVRHASIDHRLPVPGTGGFEWQARSLPYEQMPHVTNPAGGILHVAQGIDSKPISWWPRASDVSINRFSHTRADQEHFAGMNGLTIEDLEASNRAIISHRDLMTPQVAGLIDDALEPEDPGGARGEAYALFDAWRAAGYPRVDADADGKLDDPAIAIFGADGLNFARSGLWSRFIDAFWTERAGRPIPGPFVGRMGQTLAAIESPSLMPTVDPSGWEATFRAALDDTIDDLTLRQGADMTAWRASAPTTRFEAIGIVAPRAMRVVDHGTYSQIVDLGLERGENVLPPGNGRADRAIDVAYNLSTDGFLPGTHADDQLELYEGFGFKPMKMTEAEYTADPELVLTLVYPGP